MSAWKGSGSNRSLRVELTGSSLAEQLTQADAVAGVLTFSETIQYVSIYNTDGTNDGVFTINGVPVTVPKGEPTDTFGIAGTASAEVTVTGATTYIVSRWV